MPAASVEYIVFTLYLISRCDVVQMLHREPWANQLPMPQGQSFASIPRVPTVAK